MLCPLRKVLFTKVKVPGWVAILWGIITYVPDFVSDWRTRFEFWRDAAKTIGDHVAVIAAVVVSPWFGLGLIVFGVLYLVFVGEPEEAVRHPLAPVLGWVIVSGAALAFWSVLVAGYVANAVVRNGESDADARLASMSEELIKVREENKKLEDKISTLQERQQPWAITKKQKEKIAEELNKVPSGETYRLAFHVIPGCNRCNVYANDIIDVISGHTGWEVTETTNFGLDPRLTGVVLGVDPENPCPPGEIQLVINALTSANIPHLQIPLIEPKDKGFIPSPGFCALFVGDKPQE